MRRGEARAAWERVARGELDDSAMREWLARVARDLLDTERMDDPDGKARPRAIQLAVGLHGRVQDAAQGRETIRTFSMVVETPEGRALLAGNADLTPREALRSFVVALLELPAEWLATAAGRDRIDARIRQAQKAE